MIFKEILLAKEQLASGIIYTKDVPIISPLLNSINDNSTYYFVRSIYINNLSGGNIGLCPMTTLEYTYFGSGEINFSNLFIVPNSSIVTFDNIKGNITYVAISGSISANTNVNLLFQYE